MRAAIGCVRVARVLVRCVFHVASGKGTVRKPFGVANCKDLLDARWFHCNPSHCGKVKLRDGFQVLRRTLNGMRETALALASRTSSPVRDAWPATHRTS